MARTPTPAHLRLAVFGGYIGAWAVDTGGRVIGWRSASHWVNALYGMAGTRPSG